MSKSKKSHTKDVDKTVDNSRKIGDEVKVVDSVEVKVVSKSASKYSHVICKGKALTTKRGVLGEGVGICAKDLAGGDEAIAAFVKSKHVEKA